MNSQEFLQTPRISAPVRKSPGDGPVSLAAVRVLCFPWTHWVDVVRIEQLYNLIEAGRAAPASTGTGQAKVEEIRICYEVAL